MPVLLVSPLTPPLTRCSAAVLAGGRSERFGGDKPLASFRGTTLLGYLVGELLQLEFAEILIVAKDTRVYQAAFAKRPGAEASESNPLRFVNDETEQLTPLAGLLASLHQAHCDWLYVCAADMPFAADRELLSALIPAASHQAAVVPRYQGVPQPLSALWNRTRCLAPAAEMLEESVRSGSPRGPRALLQRVNAASIDWPDARPFLDADTREALARLR